MITHGHEHHILGEYANIAYLIGYNIAQTHRNQTRRRHCEPKLYRLCLLLVFNSGLW